MNSKNGLNNGVWSIIIRGDDRRKNYIALIDFFQAHFRDLAVVGQNIIARKGKAYMQAISHLVSI